MLRRSLSVAVVGILFLTGCGQTQLSDEQKAQVKELSKSASAVFSSASDQAKAIRSAARFADGEIPSELKARIQEKLKSPACTITQPKSVDSGIDTISVKVEGAECPLAMEVTVGGEKRAPVLKIYFEIRDKELLEIIDVSKMDMGGSFKLEESGSASGSLTGYIQSKKFGKVEMSMTISGNTSDAKMSVVYKFQTFRLEIGLQGNDKDIRYTINGKESSAAEINALFEGGMIPGTSLKAPEKKSSSSDKSSLLLFN